MLRYINHTRRSTRHQQLNLEAQELEQALFTIVRGMQRPEIEEDQKHLKRQGEVQGLPVDKWDAIIVHILLKKLDLSTQTLFDQSLEDNKSLVCLDELLKFIEHRLQALETRGRSGESGGARDRAKIIASATSNPNYRFKDCPCMDKFDCSILLHFVANRIVKIRELSEPNQWRHVSSKQNPADAISRGLAAESLSQHSIHYNNITTGVEINGRFVSTKSPHFGGLWEAAVKLAKHLLLRSVSVASLTYGELESIVAETEPS
ncbi:hypothetical protein EVAR_72107_1 [Eumeta japonica]|uniref:Uncharacterized protein n=1 Tax=Eumeta variegata TaxID=151549 RepID=A0A4C1T566_EUMVA|nr:hypothetical protein EVAR_72107_1 [Eumeta japonica]